MSYLISFLFVLLSFAASASPSESIELPQDADRKYEFGLALGYAVLPVYPGSSQSRSTILPAPVIRVRSKVLRSEREGGTRARFYHTKNFELSLSGGGFLPRSSDEIDRRIGMDDIDFTIELGPKLRFKVFDQGLNKIELNIFQRFAHRTDLSFLHYQGMLYGLGAQYVRRSRGLWPQIIFSVGSFWASNSYQEYFYEVGPSEVTASRAAFNAQSGYFKTAGTFVMRYEKNNWVLLGGARISDFGSNKNRESYLLDKKTTHSVFVTLGRYFYRSKSKAVD